MFLSAWRANMDFQIIMDPVACAHYIAKYTTKAEKSSKSHNSFMKDILRNAKPDDRALDLFRRMMLRGESERDMGAPEIKFMNLGLPLVSTNVTFKSISLNGKRILKFADEYEAGKFRKKTAGSSSASWKSLRDFYAERDAIEFTNRKLRVAFFKFAKIAFTTKTNLFTSEMTATLATIVENMNFNDFCYLFTTTKNVLSARAACKADHKLVIRFYPEKKPYGRGAKYREYCKYQLIRHKPWLVTPLDLCKDFMPEHIDETKRKSIELTAYTQAYQAWLESDHCKSFLDKHKQERELEQALIAHRIWTANDDAPFDAIQAQVADSSLHIPDWMQMANFSAINEEDTDINCVQRELPWDMWEQPNINELHRLNATSYIQDYVRSKRLKTPIEKIDMTRLNSEQLLAYNIVIEHFESTTKKALRMILHGIAGTGKSFVLKALKYKLQDAIFLTAPTGKAAAVINGTTTYTTLALPIEYKFELGSTSAAILQERFAKYRDCPEKCYIVIDEISLMGSGIFHWVDRRARQAFVRPDELFGGASLILVGDFGQLPPVKDKSLFNSNTAHEDQGYGHEKYIDQFDTVVMLRKNMRVCKEERKYMDILLRVRDGTTTLDDHAFFEQRFISNVPKTPEFEKAIHLFYGNKPANKRNMQMLYELQKPIMKINATHQPASAKAASQSVAQNVPPQLILAVGSDIMLTKNIWPEAGLINGTFGKIWEVIYAKGAKPPELPIYY